MSKLKGGAFLIRKSKPSDVFISEEFSEEQILIGQVVDDFCEKEIIEPMQKRGSELMVTNDNDKQKVIDLLDKSAELGLCGVAISEELGGIDLDFNTGLIFAEKIAKGGSFATTIGAHTSIGSLPIVYYGNDAQKKKYLPGVASAELKAAYALTEPGSGSDANSGKTKATLSEDGKHYILNGQKMWITNGGFAHIFIVFAKIDEDKNLTAFIVERDFGGVTTGKEEKKLGIKGSSTVQVFFNNTPVPVENLLGKRQEGFKMALNILNSGRIKLGAGSIGGAKYAITQGVKYAIEREQFKTPIAHFGAIKHKIGEAASKAFVGDAAIYRTGKNIDLKTEELKAKGIDTSEAKLGALREYAIECAIIKVYGSEAIDYIIDEVLQIYGGMGYSAEQGIEMGYRDARILKIYEGTNEINRMLSVAELTKRAIKKEINLMSASRTLPMALIKGAIPIKSKGKWDREERMVENFKNNFLLLSGKIGQDLKQKMVDEQEIVMNFANIMSEAYLAESALMKIKKLEKINADNIDKLQAQKAAVKLYFYEAQDRVAKAVKDAISSYGKHEKILYTLTNQLTEDYAVNPKNLRREIADYLISKKEYAL